MDQEKKILIFFVDDDALFLKILEIEFQSKGKYDIETFKTGEQCIQMLSKYPDVIVLDYHLNGIDKTAMDGLNTLDEIKKYNCNIPVIMLSSQDKIDVAVNCMHHKAADYIVKSETAFVRLEKSIGAILQYKKVENELNWYMQRM